jgi:hypothetical protein
MAPLLALTLTSVLIWAGLEKLRSPGSLLATLDALGLGGAPGRILAVGVPAAEVVTAVGLLLLPGAIWPRVGVAVLAVMFAVAGGLALRRDEPVSCACFGATGGASLGWRQILLLPVWLIATVALHRNHPDWAPVTGLEYLAGLTVLGVTLRSVLVVRAWRAAVGNRRAIEEAIVIRTPIMLTPEEVEAS